MLLRMVSLSSLTAASNGVSPFGQDRPRPVQGVRAVGSQPPQTGAPAAPLAVAPPPRNGGVAPGRILPRGSLLDLSV
ncbi:MAG TPA: hypothetical protein VHT74_08765 [Acetobacteraceae bacterium]|jgi:hypothetical protein|nr:hypothetical protein [Acetobacteraceae bacterium]